MCDLFVTTRHWRVSGVMRWTLLLFTLLKYFSSFNVLRVWETTVPESSESFLWHLFGEHMTIFILHQMKIRKLIRHCSFFNLQNSFGKWNLPNLSEKGRSSHRRSSVNKGVVKNVAKFTGRHLCWPKGLQHY